MLAVLLLAPVGLLAPAQAGPATAGGLVPEAASAAVVVAGGDREWQAGSLKKPYAGLFAQPAQPAPRPAPGPTPDNGAAVPRRSKTVVICGMTVFQVDIPYPPPKGIIVVNPTGFPIGRIPPPACHPEPGK
jgi:hypothetical protein